jgi:outer membrane protein OmpA-like peptidoglycan-associated protein
MTRLPPSHRAIRARAPGLFAIAAAAALLASPAALYAQDTPRIPVTNGEGLDLHLFRPAVDSKGFLSVNGADVLGSLDPSVGFVLDYGYRQMPLNEGHGAEMMLKHAIHASLQFNLGIANVLVAGISMPVLLHAGSALTDIGPGGGANYADDSLELEGVGPIALHAKLRILRPQGFLGIALLAQGGFTPGSGPRDFGSEPGFFYWPQLVVERRFAGEAFRIGVNAGYRGHTGKNPVFGKSVDGITDQLTSGLFEGSNLLTSSAALSLRVLDELDLNAEVYSTYQLGGRSDARQKLSAEAVGGIKLFIQRNSYFTLGGGAGVTPGFQSAAIRGFIGFVFEPSIGDTDGDGIKDDEDDCPTEPEDFDGFQDTESDSPPGKYGCPDPDNDEDGILDDDDACRDVAEDKDGDQDDDGCPEGGDGDKDGDGILDSRDKCPEVPEDRDGFEDKDGCPELDNDKDGIPDADDHCKNDPEDKDGFEDENGCPESDNDRDGNPDATDKCPNEPETVNGLDDEDGCPDKSSVIISGSSVVILEKIQFKTGSAEILPESNSILDQVAGTLKGHPEFRLLEVQGHADERDDDKKNLKLTQQRADSVMEALVSRGIERRRLRAMGYGEYCPVDPGRNKVAWEKNRRVEFRVVMTKEGPTGAELGCDLARAKGIISPPVSQGE